MVGTTVADPESGSGPVAQAFCPRSAEFTPANRINAAGGVMGVPSYYVPSSQPINPAPATGTIGSQFQRHEQRVREIEQWYEPAIDPVQRTFTYMLIPGWPDTNA